MSAKLYFQNSSDGVSGGKSAAVLLKVSTLSGLEYYWGTSACNATDIPNWTGPQFTEVCKRNGIGDLTWSVDISEGGRVADIGNFTVELSRHFQVLQAFNANDLHGASVQIRVVYLNATRPSWAAALDVGNGAFIIEDAKPVKQFVKIFCKSSGDAMRRDLPELITSGEFPSCPVKNLNKPKPIILGDWTSERLHKTAIGYWEGSGSSDYGNRNKYFRGYTVKESASDFGSPDGTILFAGHEIHTWDTLLGGSLASRDDSLKGWCLTAITDGTEDETTGNYLRDSVYNWRSSLAKDVYIVPDLYEQTGTSTGSNAVDEDTSNATTLTSSQTVTYRLMRGALEQLTKSSTSSHNLYAEVYYTGVLVNDVLKLTITKSGEAASPYIIANVGSANNTRAIALLADTTPDFDLSRTDYEYIDIKFEAQAVGGSDGGTWAIKNLHLLSERAQEREFSELYGCGKGKPFGEWIDLHGWSNSHNSTDEMNHPAYQLASIFVDDLEQIRRSSALQFEDNTTVPFMQAAHHAALAIVSDMQIEVWIYPISYPNASENTIFAKISGTANVAPYTLHVANTGKVRFGRSNNAASFDYAEAATTLTLNAWNHVVVSVVGGMNAVVEIFINGSASLVSYSATWSTRAVADSGSVIRFNQRNGSGTRGNHRLQCVRIWNRCGSFEEAARLYNNGLGSKQCDKFAFAAEWFFNEGKELADNTTPSAPFTVYDTSGNAIDLSSNNHANMRWRTGANSRMKEVDNIFQEQFDDVAASRSNLLCTADILDRKSMRDHAQRFCDEFGFAMLSDAQGRIAIWRSDHGSYTPFPSTITDVNSIFVNNEPTLEIDYVPLSSVFNEFTLRYHKNIATGEYERVLFVRSADADAYDASFTNLTGIDSTTPEDYWDLCSAVFARFKQVNAWDKSFDLIYDDDTAERVLLRKISELTRRPALVKYKSNFSSLLLQPFDTRRFNMTNLPDHLNSAYVSGQKFRLTGQVVSFSEMSVQNQFFDVGAAAY